MPKRIPRSRSTKNLPNDPPLRVGRSKTGLGLYALAPIKKGSFIAEYWGKILPADKADELDNKYLFEVNSKWTIDGADRRNMARYINHGCKPNAESDIKKKQVFILARRNIAAGDEITYDYGKNYFDTFIKPHGCRCVSCAVSKKTQAVKVKKVPGKKAKGTESKSTKAKDAKAKDTKSTKADKPKANAAAGKGKGKAGNKASSPKSVTSKTARPTNARAPKANAKTTRKATAKAAGKTVRKARAA